MGKSQECYRYTIPPKLRRFALLSYRPMQWTEPDSNRYLAPYSQWDSNPHYVAFETTASAVGLQEH